MTDEQTQTPMPVDVFATKLAEQATQIAQLRTLGEQAAQGLALAGAQIQQLTADRDRAAADADAAKAEVARLTDIVARAAAALGPNIDMQRVVEGCMNLSTDLASAREENAALAAKLAEATAPK